MADRSQSIYRALGVLLPRLDTERADRLLLASGALSGGISYTQAGPYAGVPEPDDANSGRMVLQACGRLDAALSADIEVRTQRAGLGLPAGEAGWVWRYTGETPWAGRDVPLSIADWEAIDWTDGGVGYSVKECKTPHALGLPDGTLAMVHQRKVTVAGVTTYRVSCSRRSRAGTWSTVTIYSSETAPTYGYYPCLWRIPGQDDASGGVAGRLMCTFWVEDPDAQPDALANVRIHTSTDGGATWALSTPRGLKDDISLNATTGYQPRRIRAAHQLGQTMMVLGLYTADNTATYSRDIFRQVASPDEGLSFSTVATWNKATPEGGAYHELVVLNGRFTLFYLSQATGTTRRPVYRQTASAFEDLRNDTEHEVDSDGTSDPWGIIGTGGGGANRYTSGDLAVALDYDGVCYVLGREVSTGGAVTDEPGVIWRSRDGGFTWGGMGQSETNTYGHWWMGGDNGMYPRDLTVAPQGGRLVVGHTWAANVGNEEDSLGAMYLGGWSTVTMPDLSSSWDDTKRVSWGQTWLPWDLPSDTIWTAAGGGTASLDSPGILHLVTAAGAKNYVKTVSGTPSEGIIAEFDIRVNSGGGLASELVGVRIKLSDGVHGYDLTVRASTTQYEVYDNLAAAVVGSAVTLTMTTWQRIRIACRGPAAGGPTADGTVSCWHATPDATARRVWTRDVNAQAITSDTLAAGSVKFGVLGIDTANVDFRWVAYRDQRYTGHHLASGQTNPDEVFPGAFYPRPYPVASTGVKVFTKTGPTYIGDTWTIPTAYDYPIETALAEVWASPRRGWRSLNDDSELTIGLQLDASADTRMPTDTLVCALFGVEQRLAYLEGKTYGGAWTTLATLNAAQGMDTVPFLRTGSTMEPDTGTAGAQHPHLLASDKAGGWARLDTNKIRRIVGHPSGVLQTSSLSGTFAKPSLVLAGVDSGDPTSGTAQLWSPNVCAIVHLCGAKYHAYRLRIPVQETPNGYFTIGTLFFGYVQVFGLPYGWGRSWEHEDGTLAEDLEDGSTIVYDAAPGRRNIEVRWESVDAEVLWGNTPAPDYVKGSTTAGARPLASPQATVYDIIGVWNQSHGQRDPVLYLPYVPQGPVSASDAIILTSKEDFWLARMTSAPKVVNIMGDEQSGEVFTASLGLREVS